MFLKLILFFKKNKPKLLGYWVKLFYSSSTFEIGENFKCDSIPDILITQNGKITIADNVYLRRNVELRSHNEAEIKIANDIRIDRGVRILAANTSTIDIKSGTRIGLYSILNGGDSITVNENCLISGFVYLQTSMHRHKDDVPIKNQGYDHKPITLGQNSWLGAHVVILPGVTLGEKCVVGSNAVVNKSFGSKETIVGVPAKSINKT